MAHPGLSPRAAALSALWRGCTSGGSIDVPCLPALRDTYLESCAGIARALHRPFGEEEARALGERLDRALAHGSARSPETRLYIRWHGGWDSAALEFELEVSGDDAQSHYVEWVLNRKQPLFGAFPDAFVFEEACRALARGRVRVLDVGAGSGRNAIPLAALGCDVTAVEPSPALAGQLRYDLDRAQPHYETPLRVDLQVADFFSAPLENASFDLLSIAQVLSSHVSDSAALEQWLARAAALTKPGGRVVWNAFIHADEVALDALTVQFARTRWSVPFSASTMSQAATRAGLTIDRRENAHDFEMLHAPLGAWPPTPWFSGWSRGLDVFAVAPEQSPLALLWFAATRQSSSQPG